MNLRSDFDDLPERKEQLHQKSENINRTGRRFAETTTFYSSLILENKNKTNKKKMEAHTFSMGNIAKEI